MNGHGAKFGRKKEEAIASLLTQRNIEEAARAIGIGANTLLRWLQVPEFKDAYRKARRDAYSQAMARIQQACGAAVSTLLKTALVQTRPGVSDDVQMPPFVPVEQLFKGRHFDQEIVVLCVRWYLSFKLSYRDLVSMMANAAFRWRTQRY